MLGNFPFLQTQIFSNSLAAYGFSVFIFLAGLALLFLIKTVIVARLKKFTEKTTSKTDDFILSLFEKMMVPVLPPAAFYFAVKQLALNPVIDRLVTSVAVVVLVFQVARLFLAVTVFLLERMWVKRGTGGGASTVSKSLLNVIKVVVWGLALVFTLDNLGFNVAAVVAGLGIGGIAVALAAQTILGDLFNYFVIFFDRPFEEGDFIIIGDLMGTIEHIGLKSTRIRSLSGEQIVMCNTDLTNSRVRNYKRMYERRVVFKLGVTYQTTQEQLKKIPVIIRGIIEKTPDTKFDRSHFESFGDSSLNVETVYFVKSGDYNKYMDIHQAINLAIKESFEKESIEFAYPTQTVYEYYSKMNPAEAGELKEYKK
ncbi:MAG: mechanosensitive ion channel family protein [Candidatus Omnitrophica bacterium]|nr:mechanosensitive ion channel family protein [Candidatus Omnitrophota bacterium]